MLTTSDGIKGENMSIEILFAFALTTITLIAIPGPTVMALIGYSIAHGRRAALPLISAVVLGDGTAILLSLCGLGTILAKSSALFQTIKIAGGIYLLYLGLKQIYSGFKLKNTNIEKTEISRKRIFINTYMVTTLNPKGIVFYVAFLPQFVTTGANEIFQLSVLACTFIFLAIINATFYCIFAAKAKNFLSTSKSQRYFNFIGGGLLSSAGIWALTSKR